MSQDIAMATTVEKALQSQDFSGLSDNAKNLLGTLRRIFSAYNNDMEFDGSGKIVMVSDTDKMVQSILKILLTQSGTLHEDSNYGSNMPDSLGGKMTSETYMNLITSIQDAISYYNDLNADNTNSSEYVDTIDSIDVSKSKSDPREIVVEIKMSDESGKSVLISVPTIN